jgi:hypothetical protein
MLETIYEAYPELEGADLRSLGIVLQDDSDGEGVWLRSWEYSKPIPDGLTLGKPTA